MCGKKDIHDKVRYDKIWWMIMERYNLTKSIPFKTFHNVLVFTFKYYQSVFHAKAFVEYNESYDPVVEIQFGTPVADIKH